jgi:hypothetical protein
VSRRTAATIQRGRKHVPEEDPDAPGCCVHCRRPLAAKSDMHIDEYPTTDPAVAAAEARRLGEHD